MEVQKNGKAQWLVYVPRDLTKTTKAERRFFPTEDAALDYCAELMANRGDVASMFYKLTTFDQVALLRLVESMPGGVSELEEAVRMWVSHKPQRDSIPLEQLSKECTDAKQNAHCSHIYVKNFGSCLRLFCAGREKKLASDIRPAEIEAWLNGSNYGAETKKGYLKNIRTLFAYALKRGYVASNPALAVERPLTVQKPPGIHTVADCARLMRTCLEYDPRFAPFLAVQYFAGLRPTEARLLTPERIGPNQIEVQSKKVRSKSRRFVTISDNLREWLDLPSDLPPVNWRKRLERVRRMARVKGDPVPRLDDFPWPHDVLRHSFASYHMAMWQNSDRTAHEMGDNAKTVFAHYREVVTKAEAEKFWGIGPQVHQTALH